MHTKPAGERTHTRRTQPQELTACRTDYAPYAHTHIHTHAHMPHLLFGRMWWMRECSGDGCGCAAAQMHTRTTQSGRRNVTPGTHFEVRASSSLQSLVPAWLEKGSSRYACVCVCVRTIAFEFVCVRHRAGIITGARHEGPSDLAPTIMKSGPPIAECPDTHAHKDADTHTCARITFARETLAASTACENICEIYWYLVLTYARARQCVMENFAYCARMSWSRWIRG